MLVRVLKIVIVLCALALVPAVAWLTREQVKPYPGLSQAQARLERGLDLLDVGRNVPMDYDRAWEMFSQVAQDAQAAAPLRERAAFLEAWTCWARPEPLWAQGRQACERFMHDYPDSVLADHALLISALLDLYDPFEPNARRAAQKLEEIVARGRASGLEGHVRSLLGNLYENDLGNHVKAADWFGQAFEKNTQAAYTLQDRLMFRYLQGKALQRAGLNEQARVVYHSMLEMESGSWTDRVWDRLEELGEQPPADPTQTAAGPIPAMREDYQFTPERPVTLSVSFWILSKQGMHDGITRIKELYEARNPSVKINLIDLPYGGYHDWLQSQILGQEIPDIVQLDNGTAIRYGAYQDRLVDMTGYLDQVNPYTGQRWAGMFWPQFISDARDPVKRRNWVISWASESSAYIYNKDAFRKAGLIERDAAGQPLLDEQGRPRVHEPATWDELMDAFAKLKQAGYYGEVCNFFPDPAPLIWQTSYVTKQLYDDLIPKLDVNVADDYPDPFEMARCMLDGSLDLSAPPVGQMWRLFYEKSEYWVPGCTAMNIQEVFDDFAKGKAACIFWVSSDLPDLKHMSDFEVGVFPFPSLEGTPYYDGPYAETPSLRAFEFAVPKITRTRGTTQAAVDFLQFFTSPQAQEIMAREANTLSPIRGVQPTPVMEPFTRAMHRRGTHLLVFNPYDLMIVKEPYFAEARSKLINELNTLLGDIPNYEYYEKAVGGGREEYASWREGKLKTFLGNLQKYFHWAYERIVQDYSEDRRQELRRTQHDWIGACRQAWAQDWDAASTERLDDLWRSVVDHWGTIVVCERMMPAAQRQERYRHQPMPLHQQRMLARTLLVALAMAVSLTLLWLVWRGAVGRFVADWPYLKWFVLTFALLAVFSYFPASSALYHAFFRWNGADISEFVGLKNFREIFADGVFLHATLVMLAFLAANILKLLPTIVVSVVLFHLASKRLQYFFRVAFVLPMIIPGIVTILVWKYFYRMDGGLLNTLFMHLHLIRAPVNWLGSEQTVVPALLFIGFPFVSTIGVLILLAGLQSIPESVFEAAMVDGCGVWRRFFTLELPLIMGQIKLNVVLITIGTIQEFALPLIVTRGGPNNASMLPGLWMYFNAFSYGKMGYAAALGVVMFLMILAFTYINMKYVAVEKDLS